MRQVWKVEESGSMSRRLENADEPQPGVLLLWAGMTNDVVMDQNPSLAE